MKRVIVDYSKLTEDILNMLVEKFPNGYGYRDIITFKNAKDETVRAVEVRTEDTIYLVKISLKLEETMEDYDADEDNFDDVYDDDSNDDMEEIPDESSEDDDF
jgi:DNA-directed RNA polymerase subunit delta